ncbi:MAG: polyprenyl synthetase family protein [Phycisphaerales bacterium]
MSGVHLKAFDQVPIRKRIDESIEEFINKLDLPYKLKDPIKYSALAPGKRVRPLLAWASAQAAGGEGHESLPAGVAVELIHAFSLVHDDLPALDNDDLRRGRPTLHIHAGEAAAILAGDAMLSLAYDAVSMVDPVPTAEVQAMLIHELRNGTRAMIAGQVYDTLGGFPDGLTDLEKLELVHTNKTGALIKAACVMGAKSAGADQCTLKHIHDFAQNLGLQFQIIDDLLDTHGDPTLVGKALRKDGDANKLTYPRAIGVDESQKIIRTLHTDALQSLDAIENPCIGLRELLEIMTSRSH